MEAGGTSSPWAGYHGMAHAMSWVLGCPSLSLSCWGDFHLRVKVQTKGPTKLIKTHGTTLLSHSGLVVHDFDSWCCVLLFRTLQLFFNLSHLCVISGKTSKKSHTSELHKISADMWSSLFSIHLSVFIESQNCLGWKRPLKAIWSPCPQRTGTPTAPSVLRAPTAWGGLPAGMGHLHL